jgi:hypothetical protein
MIKNWAKRRIFQKFCHLSGVHEAGHVILCLRWSFGF